MTSTTTENAAAKRFVLGACAQLGFEVHEQDGLYRCELPEETNETFGGDRAFTFTFDDALADEPGDSVSLAVADSHLVQWLAERLRAFDAEPTVTNQADKGQKTERQNKPARAASAPGAKTAATTQAEQAATEGGAEQTRQRRWQGVIHARPCGQPTTVHELADQLFAAYTVDDGSVHLSGCQLEDRPFLCLTFRRTVGATPRIAETLVDPQGRPVDHATQAALGLNDTAAITELAPRLAPAEKSRLVAAARRAAAATRPDATRPDAADPDTEDPDTEDPDTEDPDTEGDESTENGLVSGEVALPESDILGVTVIWLKWATGKLCFTIGQESIELPFDGWAATLRAPAFACLPDGGESFHLAATDDGRITAAEAIAVCQQSNERVLRDELVECSVTGSRVLPRFIAKCEATGRPVLQSELVPCPGCHLQVSPAALLGRGCLVCQRTTRVRRGDPRLDRVLGEYPGLQRWWNWQMAETPKVYIIRMTRLLRCLLVVLDRQSLEVVHLAQGNRLSAHWSEAPQDLWGEQLR